MGLIAFILLAIVLFLIINSGPTPQPNRWICNVLLAIAVVLELWEDFRVFILGDNYHLAFMASSNSMYVRILFMAAISKSRSMLYNFFSR